MYKHSMKLCNSFHFGTITGISRQQRRTLSIIPIEQKWDLVSAVCLERHPVITKLKSKLEEEFQEYLKQVEFENSLKADFELRMEAEAKQNEMWKKGLMPIDAQPPTRQTSQDLEDLYQEELETFQFAPRTTEADEKNITNSLDRKLDKTLLLLVEQKLGEKTYWIPPQGIRKNGETMRQTAERVLTDTCGESLSARFYGNAPIGFYKYKYPKALRDQGIYGAKVFYFLAKYSKGQVSNKAKFQWLDQRELEQTLPKEVCKSVSQFLVHE